MDDQLFPGDPARQKDYGLAELPRAAALTKAYFLGDLGAVRELGPARPDEYPEGWLDSMGYGPDQARANPDHMLVFAQIQLLKRCAREWGIRGARVAATVEKILLLPPSER